MRIALLSQSYPPMTHTAASFVEQLANQMAARGHKVLVLTSCDRATPYRTRRTNLNVLRFLFPPDSHGGDQRFGRWPWRLTLRLLREFAPDVIHIHDPLQFCLPGLYYSYRRGVPVVLTIHQPDWLTSANLPDAILASRRVAALLKQGVRWLLQRCAALVAPTPAIAQAVAAQTGYTSQVISCGVDLNTFQPFPLPSQTQINLRLKLGLPLYVPVILHVGNLEPGQHVDQVVRAAAAAMQQSPAHLLIVGEGAEKKRLQALCEKLGIAQRSHFPGRIGPRDGLPAVYRMASVFVTACNMEAQAVVLLEAAACGLPIAAFKAACTQEVVQMGKNGLLAAPEDCNDLANCLTWLLQHPAAAQDMGQVGCKLVRPHAKDQTTLAYETLYQRLLLPA